MNSAQHEYSYMPKFSILKTVIIKQNNLTFGRTIHLKNWAESVSEKILYLIFNKRKH